MNINNMYVKSFVKNGDFENNWLTLINEKGRQILENKVSQEDINKYNRMVINYRNKLLFEKLFKKYLNIEITNLINENNSDKTEIKYTLKTNENSNIMLNYNIEKNKFKLTSKDFDERTTKEITQYLENAHNNLIHF